MKKRMILNGQEIEISGSQSTPIRGIISEADFNALPEEQRNTGLYFIDDGATGGSSMEIYDDQERVIGTWFGKPLYRKSMNYILPSNDGVSIIGSINKLSTLVNLYGEVHYKYAIVPANYYDEDNYVNTFVSLNGDIAVKLLGSGYYGARMALTIEYTKTTDQAAIQLDIPQITYPTEELTEPDTTEELTGPNTTEELTEPDTTAEVSE